MPSDGSHVFEDGTAENCPDCDGDLQYQQPGTVLCLDCDEIFGHYYSELADVKKHTLRRAPNNELVARHREEKQPANRGDEA